jgi:hypothetical protein
VVRVGNAVEHREPSHTDEISVEEGDLADGDLALKRHPLLERGTEVPQGIRLSGLLR